MISGIDHPAAWPTEDLLKRCEVRRLKRGGPGGQHRNKVETAVVIQENKSGIRGEASERRSQESNRKMALFRLRVNLALELDGQMDAEQIPSQLWQSRCKHGKITISPTHDDFPSLLAEVMVALRHCDWDLASTTSMLGCTTNQLVKFLKNEPKSLSEFNQQRSQKGQRPLQ